MRVPVLCLRAEARAICERGLQAIEITADDVHALVCDESNEVLPHALTHDSRLAVMRLETFLVQNRGHRCRKSLDNAFELPAA